MDTNKLRQTEQDNIDVVNMEKTIELALNGSGFVNPEPLEGGLLLVGDQILEKVYRSAEHMENSVLEQLFFQYEQRRAAVNKGIDRAITVYLNIEPEIKLTETELEEQFNMYKELGLKRMVVGLRRPNRDMEQSVFFNILSRCEVEVIETVCYEACRELNEIFLHFTVHRTPFVFVKWAMTLDGKIATRTGDSKWISSDESLAFVHLLRQRVAAIMVGEGTVRTDNPKLTTRLNRDNISHPLRVIITRYGDIPDNAHVLQVDDQMKTLLIVSDKISEERAIFFLEKGVQLLKVTEENGRLPMKVIVERLGQMGIDSLYIEGGSAVLGDALDSGIIQKVYTAVAPKIVGGKNALTPIGGIGIETMAKAIELQRVNYELIGPDVIIKGYIK